MKIGTHGILEVQIPNLDLDIWIFNPKIHCFGKFGTKKSKLSSLAENWQTECLEDVDSHSDITFLSFEP